jgi:hypothetical protein
MNDNGGLGESKTAGSLAVRGELPRARDGRWSVVPLTPGDVDNLIAHAVRMGWQMVPQVYGGPENSLIRTVGSYTDVVTIPEVGHATVVRLAGGPVAGHLRRPGSEVWHHVVPVPLALLWIHNDPGTDKQLADWEAAPQDGDQL